MTYKPSKCLQYMDDNPGQRAWCDDMREKGDRCFHCPEHPDSPELAIAALQSELASERIKREAAERRVQEWMADSKTMRDFADLWYFAMDEAANEFEKIVATCAPANWMGEIAKVRRERKP